VTGVHLLQPWWLLLALPAAAAWALARRAPVAALRWAPFPLLPEEVVARPPLRARLLFLPGAIEILGVLALLLALARPVERVVTPLPSEGIDIVLVLDASSSMRARDMDRGRSRLDVAKAAAADFVRARPRDRIGLLTFARYPDLRCPPTTDHGSLLRHVESVTAVEGDGPEDATGIGAATARAAAALRDGPARSRVVVLLTDGEETVASEGAPDAIPPAHAGRLCEELGVRAYVVVAGSGAVAPGRPPPDTAPVRRLAAGTGGRLFEAADAAALAAAYREIGALERTDFERESVRLEERFAPLLAAAIALLLLARGLRASVLGVLP
jgi:Ca-activated chloride channel family protein